MIVLVIGRMCLEAGAYLMNYLGCSQCGSSELVTRPVDNTDTESRDSWDTEEEDVEIVEDIQYSHVCGACGHIIAIHKVSSDHHHDDVTIMLQYKFWLEEGRQEYRMECLLCGIGEDSTSVMPHDPRKASSLEA